MLRLAALARASSCLKMQQNSVRLPRLPVSHMTREAFVLVTGFGPYEEILENPSRALAQELELRPPPGVRVAGRELPVSFAAAPREVERVLSQLGATPTTLLGLGMQRKPWFRLERLAHGQFDTQRFDNDGMTPPREPFELGPTLETSLDLVSLAQVLRDAGAKDVRISEDAGGYVCERVYYELLRASRRLSVPALFLHVPPMWAVPVAAQFPIVSALVGALGKS